MGHTQSRERAEGDARQPREIDASGSTSRLDQHQNEADQRLNGKPSSSTTAAGNRKRRLSASPSERGHSDHDNSQSRRKRRLPWRSSFGRSRSSRSVSPDGEAEQQHIRSEENSGAHTDMQLDEAEASGRKEQEASSSLSQYSRDAPSQQVLDGALASSSHSAGSQNSHGTSQAPGPAARQPAPEADDPFGPSQAASTAAGRSIGGDSAGQSTADEPSRLAEVDGIRTPPPHLDELREERERARRSIEAVLGRPASTPTPPPESNAGDAAAASRAAPSTLSALLGDVFGIRPGGAASSDQGTGGASPTAPSQSTSGPAPVPTPQTPGDAGSGARPHVAQNLMSGTSVIVQGALIARTLPSRRDRQPRAGHSTDSGSSQVPSGSGQGARSAQPSSSGVVDSASQSGSIVREEGAPSSTAQVEASQTEEQPSRPRVARRASEPSVGSVPRLTGAASGEEPQAATLEEQAAMLGRILGIATAATAASLVNPTSSQAADRALLQSTLQPAVDSIDGGSRLRRRRFLGQRDAGANAGPNAPLGQPVASAGGASGLGQGLRNRLMSLSNRARSIAGASDGPVHGTANTPAATSPIPSGGRHLSESQQAAAALLESLRQAGEVQTSPDSSATAGTTPVQRVPPPPQQHQQQPQQDGSQQATVASAEDELARSATRSSLAHSSSSASLRSTASSATSAWSRLLRDTARHIISSTRGSRRSGSAAANAEEQTANSDNGGNGTGSGSRNDGTARTFPDGHSMGPNDIEGPLRLVREGLPVPQGEPGSFGRFLYQLLGDLTAAVTSIRPPGLEQDDVQTSDYFERANEAEATNGAEVLDADNDGERMESSEQNTGSTAGTNSSSREPEQHDGSHREPTIDDEVRARRESDVQGGQLSFFRLFRFDPVAPSTLVPCVVVGVRSLGMAETLHGEAGIVPPGSGGAAPAAPASGSAPATSTATRPTTLGSDPEAAQPAGNAPGAHADGSTGTDGEGDDGQPPASRFLLFVSGGRYPVNHPLLSANPSAAGRDLMILLELLGMMSAMQSKPSTATQREIDESDALRKVRVGDIAKLLSEGKVKENTAERCLVCLEDWADDDDCRLLACQHVFHAGCVDRWLTSSSNTCPMCRRQGVTKDGTSAGEETPESRSASA